MDRSSASHSPTRMRSKSPVPKPHHARGTSTASGMAANAGTTGNTLLDHSLRIDHTRRTDNTRRNNNHNNNSSSSININNNSPPRDAYPLRGRAYSWRGEKPPATRKEKGKTGGSIQPSELVSMINREARSVTMWVIVTATIQFALSVLAKAESYEYPRKGWVKTLLVIPSVLAGVFLRVLPEKVVRNKSSGFIYASAW